MAVVFETESDN